MTQRGYSRANLAEVSDTPELTAEDLAQVRPFGEVFPQLAGGIRQVRGKQKTPTKVSPTIRLSREVLEHFRASGGGWQARIDGALREWIARR